MKVTSDFSPCLYHPSLTPPFCLGTFRCWEQREYYGEGVVEGLFKWRLIFLARCLELRACLWTHRLMCQRMWLLKHASGTYFRSVSQLQYYCHAQMPVALRHFELNKTLLLLWLSVLVITEFDTSVGVYDVTQCWLWPHDIVQHC